MANIYKSNFTGQEIDEILTKAKNANKVEANPTTDATDNLSKLTVGNTTYSVPTGVNVEANPSGDATAELSKLKVGETIYSIPNNSGEEVSGLKLYKHIIKSGNTLVCEIVSTNAGPVSLVNGIKFLKGVSFTRYGIPVMIRIYTNSEIPTVMDYVMKYYYINSSDEWVASSEFSSITDTVEEIIN